MYIILQCTFCIMGQQPNYSSELNLIKIGVVIASILWTG